MTTTLRRLIVGGPDRLRPAARELAATATARCGSGGDPGTLEFVVHELAANALEHGHLGDRHRGALVEVVCSSAGGVLVRVVDAACTGPWTPPAAVEMPAPTAARGRGLALIVAAGGQLRVVSRTGCTRVEVALR